MKIFLIGMPGAGKSTLGKLLSEKMILPLFDLDKEIENIEQKTVQDIFRESGEEYFRKMEAAQLRTVSEQNHSFVMATGGGTPCFYESVTFMKQQGKVVFINNPVEILFERIKKSNERPLLQLESNEQIIHRLKKIQEERMPFYTQAHLTINDTMSLQQIIELILKKENPL